MFKEHDYVVLTTDPPSNNLVQGDVGTVVHIHPGEAAFEVEFATLAGETVAVLTIQSTQCRPVGSCDMNHVREMPRRVGFDPFGEG